MIGSTDSSLMGYPRFYAKKFFQKYSYDRPKHLLRTRCILTAMCDFVLRDGYLTETRTIYEFIRNTSCEGVVATSSRILMRSSIGRGSHTNRNLCGDDGGWRITDVIMHQNRQSKTTGTLPTNSLNTKTTGTSILRWSSLRASARRGL